MLKCCFAGRTEYWTNERTARFFAGIFLLAGLLLLVLVPPGCLPDEHAHVIRSIQLSQGTVFPPLVSFGSNGINTPVVYLPSAFMEWEKVLQQFVGQMLQGAELHWAISDTCNFLSAPYTGPVAGFSYSCNVGIYSPLAHLPMAVGAFLGGLIFPFSAGAVFYIMRLSALLFASFFVYRSLLILPEKRLLIILVSMMPMFISECASVSSDAVILPLCMYFVCWFGREYDRHEQFNGREYAFLIFAAVLLGLVKVVYGTILLMYFFLPAKRFPSKKIFWIFGGILLIFSLSCGFGWQYFAVTARQVSMNINLGSDSAAQFVFVSGEPLRFAEIFWGTLRSDVGALFRQVIGVLGMISLRLPDWFYWLYSTVLLLAAVSGCIELKLWQRLILLLGAGLSFVAIYFSLYIFWTPVMASVITGVQGRYMIPLLFMAFFGLTADRRLPGEMAVAVIASLLSSAVTLISVWQYYY